MNDNTKVLDQNPVTGSQVQPSAPVGVANKEIGPVPPVISELKPSGPEVKHEISQESVELGVKETQNRPDLTKVVDMHHAGPSVPVPTAPTSSIQYPMSEEEIANQLKTGQDDDSKKGLAKLIQKVIAWGLRNS